MSTAIGIDPGVLALGYAISYGPPELRAHRLEAAGCSIQTDRRILAHVASRHEHAIRNAYDTINPVVFVESMTIQRGRETTPQDLIDVQTVGLLTAADAAGGIAEVVLFTPAEWKGSTPKEIHHRRMCAPDGPLDESERAVLRDALERTPAKHHKEVLDAVGILLYGLGRIERSGKKRGAT